ncbi:histidinol-phosphate aminotransferase [Clostridiales bacterium]|nr:histidinol-phosphate aminotransferase [Clostridiales bacterium]
MSRFLSQRFAALEPYTPGEQPQDRAYVKLNTNESPYPPSSRVLEAVNAEQISMLNLYPDPTCHVLREKLADTYGVQTENVFVTNGSDDILNMSFMAFCDRDHGIAFPDITYGFYSVYGQLHDIPCRVIPLTEDFQIRVSDYVGIDSHVIIANPNAPTGIALSLEDIEKIVQSNPDHVVMIDEAYVDFGAVSALPLLQKYKNLLIIRTYSKSRSLAGARLGFAIGDAALIEDLERIKYSMNPYDINRLTQIAGIACLESDDYYKANAENIMQTREYTKKALEDRGFVVLPSSANFVFAKKSGTTGKALYQLLRENGVLVRWFDKDRIQDFLRITIGTREQMDKLLLVLDK